MRTLDEITVVVPDVPDGGEWGEAEDEAEPAEVPLIRVQRLLAGLLAEARPPEEFPRPMLIAWLMLWTRVFQGLEGLRGAAVRRSLYSARVISRTLFETNVQVRAIARNLTDTSSRLPEALKRRSVEDRLHAYLAWSIHQDLDAWRHFLRARNLDAVFDPKPARDFARKYGHVVPALGALVEEYETLTDAEARAEREEAKSVADQKIEEYSSWLQDERLLPFSERLNREEHRSFYSFLDPNEKSVRGALDADGVPYAYGIYARGSAVAHGTTCEGLMSRIGPAFAPQVWATDDSIASAVGQGLRSARNTTFGLFLIRPRYLLGG